MSSEVMVSICCITYNHEKYIRDTLEGFLNQETNFKFEILIHDDASTDNTASIIKEYEKNYPDIIKAIYQTENQYSKNIKITAEFLFPIAKGKYIAMCEGDDFWIDKNKLQTQVDFLENNKDFSLCVHGSTTIDEKTQKRGQIRGYKENTVLGLKKFLKDYYNNKIVLFQTSSYVFRKHYIEELIDERPEYYYKACVGDTPLVLFLGTKGLIYYIDRIMSVYRVNTPLSWTLNEYNTTKRVSIDKNLVNMYKNFNKMTQNKYYEEVNLHINSFKFTILFIERNYREMLNDKYRLEFKKLNLKSKVFIMINIFSPKLGKKIRKIKERLLENAYD